MTPPKRLLTLLTSLLVIINSAHRTNADLVVTQDLGVLATGSSTLFKGDTATGANNADTYTNGTAIDEGATWANEVVFQFTVRETMRIDITSITITGDPDVFILTSLETEAGAAGLNDATGAILFAYLDATPPETATLGILPPGTYYISIDTFGVANATFSYNLIATPGTVPKAKPLGKIAEEDTPFTIDTIGTGIDTEICVWNSWGGYLMDNDDAFLDFDGDGFFDIVQSQINFPGLASGTYYVAIGSYDTLWSGPFTFIGSPEGGLITFNYGASPPPDVLVPTPAEDSVAGTLVAGNVLWYSFEIGKLTPPAPLAPLRITNITRNADGHMIMTFNSMDGREYAVDISADMSEWQELTDGLIGKAKSTTYTHTSPDRAARTLFYRIRELGAAPLE